MISLQNTAKIKVQVGDIQRLYIGALRGLIGFRDDIRKAALLGASALLLIFVTSVGAAAQTWIQLAPAGTPPPAGAGVGALDQTKDRMIIVYPNGNPQTSWVLTNADGLGGTPQWLSFVTLPDPVYGPAPSRGELPTAVYDATSNRVITFAGCMGNCGSPTNDVWALTNANGLSGTPRGLNLAP